MGYAICTTPGPRWFTARALVLQPLKDLESIQKTSPKPDIHHLIRLQKLRLDLARGILLIAGKVPLSGDIYELLRLAADAHPEGFNEWPTRLRLLSGTNFEVHYSGSGQYGVPNYHLRRGSEEESSTKGLGPLFHIAYEERLTHARELRDIALEMLCEIYLSERSFDINYYSYWETMKDDQVLAECLANNLFPDEASGLAACDGDLYNLRKLSIVRDLGERLNLECWMDEHDQDWARFDECEALWNGCSD